MIPIQFRIRSDTAACIKEQLDKMTRAKFFPVIVQEGVASWHEEEHRQNDQRDDQTAHS